ncbi:hypothetical protein [Corallococcus sp. CA054B]|uniref:hypothetical protein n=1 Tax=Corallococcus sp. CA054B TaxID=2316734 RepID=UPI0011C3F534|nr:hypothetical protein [Corallococcus sp. CA054B]
MKIRLLGATFKAGSVVTLDDLDASFEESSGQLVTFGGCERMYLSKRLEEYNVGLLISIKNQRRFCTLLEKPDGFEVDVHELEDKTRMMDFNYFVQSRSTGRALYQYYHHSCALSRFAAFLGERYSMLKHRRMEAELQSAGGQSAPVRVQKAIRSSFKGQFEWAQMLSAKQAGELIEQLEEVSRLELKFATFGSNESDFRPLNEHVQRGNIDILFKREHRSSPTLRGKVRSLIQRVSPANGLIEGRDAEGVKQFVRLADNIESFGEFDFERTSGTMKFDLKKFHESKMIGDMIEVMKENRALFDYPEAA